MIWLVLGLALWTAAHLFKRLAPDLRAGMGNAGRGLVTVLLLLSIWLMVKGYGQADGPYFWGRNAALVGINNLLMLVSVYLFAAAGAKTALARRIRHPMLTAVKVWATAHILVNGDLPSFILFGGLLAWAVVEVIVLNRAEPEWTRPEPAPRDKEIKAVIITLVIYGVIAGIHTWLGYPVFG
ncbi:MULTISPECIES: NnrU family protein [unclassified Roseovarius]|uniref:NnrU family protein n=1 Tax=unclassified Roseovarius TaxID=2614913 RepID=UPI00273DDB6D|nr:MULTISPECIES: NnrU family protein [unclassified Roseovarius]